MKPMSPSFHCVHHLIITLPRYDIDIFPNQTLENQFDPITALHSDASEQKMQLQFVVVIWPTSFVN